jgi:hypothetical protein
MLRKAILIVVLAFAATASHAQLPIDDDAPLMTGKMTKAELYEKAPVFRRNAEIYDPPADIVDGVSAVDEEIEMLLFLGTWNTDSQILAARFLRLIEAASNPNLSVTIFGVGRGKNEPTGTAQKYGILWIPTVVFKKGGDEYDRLRITSRLHMAERTLEKLSGE